MFRKVLVEEPMPLSARRADVPAGLAAVIHRALARREEERYADVREMARALAGFG
jgi:eukaryotic-like serine/threonine-protein kinase